MSNNILGATLYARDYNVARPPNVRQHMIGKNREAYMVYVDCSYNT